MDYHLILLRGSCHVGQDGDTAGEDRERVHVQGRSATRHVAILTDTGHKG